MGLTWYLSGFAALQPCDFVCVAVGSVSLVSLRERVEVEISTTTYYIVRTHVVGCHIFNKYSILSTRRMYEMIVILIDN